MIVDRDNLLEIDRPVNPLKVTSENIDTIKVVGDFLRSENSLVSSIETGLDFLSAPKFENDPEYVPEDDMEGYEPYASELVGARNANEMSFLKKKIDDENSKKEDPGN